MRKIQRLVYVLLSATLLLSRVAHAQEMKDYSWELRDGKFVKIGSKIEDSIEIKGKIKWFTDSDQGLFYISSLDKNAGDNKPVVAYYLGLIDKKEAKIVFEKELPVKEPILIKKGFVKGNILYAIIQNDLYSLYTIDFTTMDIIKEDNVYDFMIISDRFYYVKNANGATMNTLISGREHLSLTLKGPVAFKNVLDERLVLLGSADGVEVIDLKKLKSIYAYTTKTEFTLPDAYNFVVEAVDQTEKIDAENFVFYKIFIDGVEKGRTATGLPQIVKVYKEKIDSGTHIVQLERWKLHKAAKRYRRENNINQPDPFKLYIPENRIIKLKVGFDGRKHTIENVFVND